jgi:hypothetical protein
MFAIFIALIFGGFILAIAWFFIFWVASFFIYLIALILSLFGIYMGVDGEKNVWLLFLVVCGISWWVSLLDGSNIGYAIFVFFTGSFMLFRSANVWKISS